MLLLEVDIPYFDCQSDFPMGLIHKGHPLEGVVRPNVDKGVEYASAYADVRNIASSAVWTSQTRGIVSTNCLLV